MASSSGDSLSPPRLRGFRKTKCYSRLPGARRFPGISAKLVRMCEITGNLHRCKKIFEKFCQRRRYRGNRAESSPKPEPQAPQRNRRRLRFPFVFLCALRGKGLALGLPAVAYQLRAQVSRFRRQDSYAPNFCAALLPQAESRHADKSSAPR